MKKAQGTVLQTLRLWVFLFSLMMAMQVQALPIEGYWLCRRAPDVRTLRIESKDGSCVSWYTKDGLDEKVAESKEGQLCYDVVDRIKETLLAAGWKCKDISRSRITE